MRKIDLEAHFYTQDYEKYLLSRKKPPNMEITEDAKGQKWVKMTAARNIAQTAPLTFYRKLSDMGEGRLKEMDEAGIDIQVLTLSVGCEQYEAKEGTEWAARTNDELAEVVKKYPKRFLGMAALAPQDPDAAASELERTVKKLGFRGAKINSHVRGEYLDDKKYWGIFEVAEKLDVPIYIHPWVPSPGMIKPYEDYGFALAGPVLGFGAEVAVHVMRLIYSGVFDKYPRLKIILGHMGEGLPFWLWRLDFFWMKQDHSAANKPKCQRKPTDYLKDNFTMTTSGLFFQPAFLCCYLALGADRMAFSVDHPFEDGKIAVQFMEQTPICDSDKEKIYHLNAEKLLKIWSAPL